MLKACLDVWTDCNIGILSAAVADYKVANISKTKIKREGNDVPTINLIKNPDIAAILGKHKATNQYLLGFALETDNEHSNAKDKIQRKNLDAIILNSLRDNGAGFGFDTNKITIIESDGVEHAFDLKSKREVANDITLFLAKRLSHSE